MARGNKQNLIPQQHVLTVDEQSKGGRRTQEKKKIRKSIQTLVNDYLDGDCKDNAQLRKLARQLGISDEGSVKQLFTAICILNSIKGGNLKDLETLQHILGEEAASEKDDDVKVIIDV